ncbi:hypothetical protein TWF730_003305 [Orbilia blumenaviensis]|uniref:Nucleoside phosphorylase domain-containing protein n=1 Tax=Orbilia blumenaviensis TaxID=1796055 RepID=A0AAV9U5F6_9PEZI
MSTANLTPLELANDILPLIASVAIELAIETRVSAFSRLGVLLQLVSEGISEPPCQHSGIYKAKIDIILEIVETDCIWPKTVITTGYPKLESIVAGNSKLKSGIYRGLKEFSRRTDEFGALLALLEQTTMLKDAAPEILLSETETAKEDDHFVGYSKYVNDALYTALDLHTSCSCSFQHLKRVWLKLDGTDYAWPRSKHKADETDRYNGGEIQFKLVFSGSPSCNEYSNPESDIWHEIRILMLRKRLLSQKLPEGNELAPGEFCERLENVSASPQFYLAFPQDPYLFLSARLNTTKQSLQKGIPGNGLSLGEFIEKMGVETPETPRFRLAYILAKSVWQYYGSHLMKNPWTHKDIWLLEEERSAGEEYSGLVPSYCLHFTFNLEKPDDRIGEYCPNGPHRYPAILAVAMMLIEIIKGKLFDDEYHQLPSYGIGQPYDYHKIRAQYELAWLESLILKCHPIYKEVVTKCFDRKIFDMAPFDHDDPRNGLETRKSIIYREIVLPLKTLMEMAEAFDGTNGLGPHDGLGPYMVNCKTPETAPIKTVLSTPISDAESEASTFTTEDVSTLPQIPEAIIELVSGAEQAHLASRTEIRVAAGAIQQESEQQGRDAEEVEKKSTHDRQMIEESQSSQQDINEQEASITVTNTFATATTAITATAATTVSFPDSDDVKTVYSEASSVTPSAKEHYISQLADALSYGIRTHQLDSETLGRISIVLPELLKIFALKVGYNASSQTHRDIMFFVHKYRGDIAEYFMERCSREEVESLPDAETTDSENMTWSEKMNFWHERSEHFPISHGIFVEDGGSSHDEGHEADTRDVMLLVPSPQGEAESEDAGEFEEFEEFEDADIVQSLVYRDLIFNAPAFEWLVGSLRREVILTSTESNHMETIKNSIIKSLPQSYRVSKHRSTEAFQMIFMTGWKPLVFVGEQEYENEPSEAIERAITLTGSAEDAQALICAQYLYQTWPSTGKHIIKLIKEVAYSILPDNTKLTAYLMESSELVVEALGTKDSVAEIGQQLAWLCTALSSSSHETGVIACIPLIKDIKVFGPKEMVFAAPTPDPRNSADTAPSLLTASCQLSFTVEEREEKDILSNSQCWHNMFKNPVIVKGYPILRRPAFNTGLEIPLNMMAGLAGTKYVQTFNDKLFIKGFSTLLIPTKREGDTLIWHLVCNEDGNRISYFEDTVSHAEKLSFSELETTRHVVGWCPKAGYYAGAADANYDVRPSQLLKPHKGCLLQGIRISRRREIRDGAPFNLGNKDRPFHVSGNISVRKLQHIHNRFVVLWDDQDKRGWLVNGTSALLHLLRKSLESDRLGDFGSQFCFKKEHMQEALETHKPDSAIDVLLNKTNLKQEIYPEKEGYFCVEDRLEELYDTLDKMVEHQDNIAEQDADLRIRAQEYLEGWDFNHLATVQDIIHPRVAGIRETGTNWVHFVQAIHAVVLFGRGFGEIIKPQGSRSCAQWAKLPKDNYYLAAAVKDLKKIMDRNSGQEANPMKLTDDIFCHSPQVVFEPCECKGEEGAERHSDFAHVLLHSKFCSTLPLNSPAGLQDGGAVIFGHNRGTELSLGDIGYPKEHELLSSAEEPETQSHDSGLGSSLGLSFSTCEDYTVGIVCALPKELLAVRAMFDSKHEKLEYPPEDTNQYALGCIHQHYVVAAGLPLGEYGTCAAADVLTNMKRSFPRLKICLLVGIGGGVPSERNDIRLGDVVVSQPRDGYPGVIQYDLGKTLEKGVFERTGILQPPPRFIMTAITDLESDPDKSQQPLEPYLRDIANPKYKYPGHKHDPLLTTNYDRLIIQNLLRPRNYPKIHYGLIASGNQVMKCAQTRDKLGSEYNILCFEMEAAGIMNTCACLVIRGICDYSDSQKNDIWQEYAAATAAAYAKLLLSYARIPTSLVADSENTRSIRLRAPESAVLPNKRLTEPKRSSYKNWLSKTFRGLRGK